MDAAPQIRVFLGLTHAAFFVLTFAVFALLAWRRYLPRRPNEE